MTVQPFIDKLIDHDVFVTPAQAALLTERDALVLSKLLDKPEAVEQYLRAVEERARLNKVTAPKPVNAVTNGFPAVQVLKHYDKKPKKRSYNDFVQYYNSRFQAMEKMLRSRKELASVMNIERTKQFAQNGSKQTMAIIGLVLDKRETKNEHILLDIEDRSGSIAVLINKNKPELIEFAKDLSFDEIIGITGTMKEDLFFADTIITPNIPIQNELKKAPDDVYAVCVSDIHFGNKNFFEKEFTIFLDWLRGEVGTPEARAIAKKVQYVFVPGDIVEGVGVYPSQEDDLSIPDIYAQYRYADEVLNRIPMDKHIILIPGNHDIGRLSEPQPRMQKELFPLLSARDNVHFLSNPSTVRIHQKPGFPGFTCLLYHGGSFFYYGNNVMRLFREGGMSNPVGIMQYLLQKRHLAPTHTATLYVPDSEEDPLVIDEVPDFFISGHLHTTQSKTWNGISLLSCSCWVPLTEYQIKAGLKIDPGKFMLINLKTRAIEALKPEELLDS